MILGEFCDVYPPELDGVGAVVSSYAEGFNKREDTTCYYIAPEAPDYKPTKDYPVLNYLGVPIPNEAYRLGLPDVDFTFRADLLHKKFDILHAHSPFTAGRMAVRLAQQKNLPLVGTFHSKYYDDFYSKTRSEWIARLGVKFVVDFYDRCDEVWAVNHATAQVLKDYGFQKEIHVMPNGTDLWYPTEEDRQRAQKEFSLGSGSVLLFVGQHNFKKNTRHILEAVALYARTNQNFVMAFAGQGPDAEAMKQLAEELGLNERVRFLGHIMDRKQIMGLYARADLLVFPSLYDNAPMVVREAAAAGTPALLIRGSCAAEGVTDGKNGFLCEDTPESIAETIGRALPNSRTVGEEARRTIPLPWQRVVELAADRYVALIERYRSGELSRASRIFGSKND